MKVGIIGFGNIGHILYERLVDAVSQDDVFVYDKNKEKIPSNGIIKHVDDVNDLVRKVDVVLFAVKPQSLETLCETISEDVSEKLIVSVMAGVTLRRLQELSGAKRIVRTMPNLPIKYGKGVIGWVASEDVSPDEKVFIENILDTMGHEVEILEEEKINNITALSGSGPAYFFYLVELLAKKAEDSGFSKDEAQEIAVTTLVGSAELLKKDDKTAREWREAVTSKGGTTEAALSYMEENNFDTIFLQALDEARKRAEDLSS
ncbi:pyrroline-5-carboxylate reductase [Candidatus Parcubacteria bacterium]|nr:MAG: pyrroline-5-carboxylate reductase [Candidatus Parcubacteria bacterium]